CALRWLRWWWPRLGNDRHAAHHGENERRRPPCLAYADPAAHRRRLAKHPDRRPHALELQPVAASPTRLRIVRSTALLSSSMRPSFRKSSSPAQYLST